MKTSIIRTRVNKSVLTAFLLTAVSLRTALSQGVAFTDRSTFEALLQSKISINLDNLAPVTGQSTISVPPFLNFISGGNLNGGQGYVGAFDGNIPMTISGPTTRNAFGADFSGGLAFTFTGTLTFNLVDGSSAMVQFPGIRDGFTFFGVVLPKNISSVIFDDGGNSFPGSHQERIHNIIYGVAAVPEPGIAALLLLGGFSCSMLNRKNRRFGI